MARPGRRGQCQRRARGPYRGLRNRVGTPVACVTTAAAAAAVVLETGVTAVQTNLT